MIRSSRMLALAACSGVALIASLAGQAVASPTAMAQPANEEALRIVERGVIALADAKSLKFKATYRPEGVIESMFPSASGTISARRPAGEEESAGDLPPFDLRVAGEGAMKKGDEPLKFDVARKDNQFYWLDHEAKYLRIRPVMSRNLRDEGVRLARNVAPDEIFGEEPFKRLLDSEELSIEGRETINGVACVGVSAPTGRGGGRRQIVYFGVEDGLPRRIVQAFETEGLSGSIVTDITELETGVPMPSSLFEIEAPDGYNSERASAEPVRAPEVNPNAIRGVGGDEQDAIAGEDGPTPPPVQMAPGFSLQTPEGDTVSLESLQGNLVVLDFWGTWCLPCLKAAPELQELYEDYKDLPVKVYGINFRERDPQKAIDKMKELGLEYGLLLKGDSVAREYEVRQFPTYVLIGYDGAILRRVMGHEDGVTFNTIRQTIDEYLRAQGVNVDRAGGE